MLTHSGPISGQVRADNSSGYKGVTYMGGSRSKPFFAQVKQGGKDHSVRLRAPCARDRAATAP